MSLLEEIKNQVAIGQPILNKLFTLSDDQIRAVLQKLSLSDSNFTIDSDLIKRGSVIRTIEDEVNTSIKFCYYSLLTVTALGVVYQPEHGNSEFLVKFGSNPNTLLLQHELGFHIHSRNRAERRNGGRC